MSSREEKTQNGEHAMNRLLRVVLTALAVTFVAGALTSPSCVDSWSPLNDELDRYYRADLQRATAAYLKAEADGRTEEMEHARREHQRIVREWHEYVRRKDRQD
jgi:hypothetical protein